MRSRLFSIVLLTLTASSAAFAGVAAKTPEPATITLLGTGIAAMGLVAWRKARKK